jgi:hypothetical protein
MDSGIPDDGSFKGSIVLDVAGALYSPPSRAYKRLVNGVEDSLLSYVTLFAEKEKRP